MYVYGYITKLSFNKIYFLTSIYLDCTWDLGGYLFPICFNKNVNQNHLRSLKPARDRKKIYKKHAEFFNRGCCASRRAGLLGPWNCSAVKKKSWSSAVKPRLYWKRPPIYDYSVRDGLLLPLSLHRARFSQWQPIVVNPRPCHLPVSTPPFGRYFF